MENEVNIDLGQVEPIKGIDYYTEEEVNAFEDDVANTIKNNMNQTYQTTANKTNELNESSTSNQYPNAQITYKEFNKRDKKIDYVDTCNKGFRSSIPTDTEEGEAVNLTECSNLPLKDFKLKGGKNYFNPATFITKNNVSCDSNGLITSTGIPQTAWSYAASNIKLTLLAGTYTFTTFKIAEGEGTSVVAVKVFNSSNTELIQINRWASGSITLTENTDIGIMFKLRDGDEANFQIETGSTATEYEPYKTITRR